MGTYNFKMLIDKDIVSSIHSITKEGYDLKKEIFKTASLAKKLDTNVIKIYLSSVNSFLRYWDDYSKDLKEKIQSSKGVEKVWTIEYSYVKNYIYAKYDYASVLPFTDGLIKGISSGKFKTVDDIEDFRNYTISKAFKDQPDSIGGLLDAVLIDNKPTSIIRHIISDTYDAKMFDSIRSYNMFEWRSRQELYNAIFKTVEFMTTQVGVGGFLTNNDMRIFSSMVNNVMDYITYSLTAYASRIYIISVYAYPFINASNVVHESTTVSDVPKTVKCDIPSVEIDVFRNAEDTICRDPKKTKEFIEIFNSFLKLVDVDNLFGSNKPSWDSMGYDKTIEPNRFYEKMVVNPLYKFLILKRYDYKIYTDASSIIELNQVIKELIYNSSQGIQGTSSPKQDIFQIIRGISSDNETLKGYQELAKDLYLCTLQLCWNTNDIINNIIRWKKKEITEPQFNTGVLNAASEALKGLSEFYRDLAEVILHKCRDIEIKINQLRVNENHKVGDMTSISVPNKNTDKEDVTTILVPDTTRVAPELMDLYDRPTFEWLELYDEYVKSLPGMKDEIYYSEAFNISTIINQLIAHIKAAIEKFQAFRNNNSVKAAIRWVTTNENAIRGMDFSSVTMTTKAYKKTIMLPNGFDNLTNNLKNFNTNVLKSSESIQEFIKTLYPDQDVYNWFYGKDTNAAKNGAVKYRNYILFHDKAEVTDQTPGTIQLNSQQVNRAVDEWINNIKAIDNTSKGLSSKGDELNEAIKVLRNKIAGIKDDNSVTESVSDLFVEQENAPNIGNTNNTTSQNTNVNTNPSTNNSGASQSSSNSTTNTNNSNNDMGNTSSYFLTEVDLAIIRIFKPLGDFFAEYCKDSYNYLKEAYTKSQGNRS